MARLIDADAMANRLRDSLKEHHEWHHMTMGMIEGFIKEIEEEPTAYDVEKVVAEEEKFLVNYGVPKNTPVHRKIIDIIRKGWWNE